MTLRPVVLWFAALMEAKLRKHDATRGERGWSDPDETVQRLLYRVQDEYYEAQAIAFPEEHPDEFANECADIANMAMMAADKARGCPDFLDATIAEGKAKSPVVAAKEQAGEWQDDAPGSRLRWHAGRQDVAAMAADGWTAWRPDDDEGNDGDVIGDGPEVGDLGQLLADVVLVAHGYLSSDRAFCPPGMERDEMLSRLAMFLTVENLPEMLDKVRRRYREVPRG